MNQFLGQCLACTESDLSILFQTRDSESAALFTLIKCGKCGHATVENKPNSLELPGFYTSNLGNSMRTKPGPLFERLRRIRIRRDLKGILSRLGSMETIIDFGTGDGSVAAEVQRLGHRVEARDLYPLENWTIPAIPYQATDMGSTPKVEWFQVNETSIVAHSLILRHVLEHVPDPVEFLRIAGKAGVRELLVIVPNVESKWARRFGENWCMWDPPRHLNHFSRHSLSLCAKQAGYKVESETLYGIDEYVSSLWRRIALNRSPAGRNLYTRLVLHVLRPTGPLAGFSSSIAAIKGETAIRAILVYESPDS